jgi:hypothetical protein
MILVIKSVTVSICVISAENAQLSTNFNPLYIKLQNVHLCLKYEKAL